MHRSGVIALCRCWFQHSTQCLSAGVGRRWQRTLELKHANQAHLQAVSCTDLTVNMGRLFVRAVCGRLCFTQSYNRYLNIDVVPYSNNRRAFPVMTAVQDSPHFSRGPRSSVVI